MKIDDATHSQNTAANPDRSTWLSANAGSGKTRVLTDRVARLLLRGVEPQNILCLTYTKAAASEMQNRLFSTLGSWAMVEDEALRTKLQALGEMPDDDLADARRLFAGAIEAPGGLKIQTIHSFCSAVLRQFPLEAGINPQFRELDEDGQRALIEQVLDELAGCAEIAEVAKFYSDQDLISLGMDVAGRRTAFQRMSKEEVFAAFGLNPSQTMADVLKIAFQPGDWAFLQSIVSSLRHSSVKAVLQCAQIISSAPTAPNATTLIGLEGPFLFGEKAAKPFGPKIGQFPDKPIRTSSEFVAHVPRLDAIMRQISFARQARIQLQAGERAAALHAFAGVFLPAYEAAKSDSGMLDFDDLIQKTKQLLRTDSLAWVLYRLDSNIDHILIDEAQDTSPIQWDVITSISDEITAGQGSRENKPRTLFVVGDKKQSIYSFQGADAEGFDRMSARLHEKLKGGQGLQQNQLLHSFRSSPAILTAVDHVFDDEDIKGLGDAIEHKAFHSGKPGRVDLWDLVPSDDGVEEPEWFDPSDRLTNKEPAVVLAGNLAREIRRMIETETIIGKNGERRRVEPRDILILVQARNKVFDQIISACKAMDLPMAGADRLNLNGALAVKDLLALLSFLALPDDSLALAAALKSPLFGWSEQDLYGLAQGRRQSVLWAELRDNADKYPETMDILLDLRRVVDTLRPFELLERILARHMGRSKLIGRLGLEAEDGIDELLNQALVYENEAVPSLTGFLVRTQDTDIQVKRQADNTGNLIRVMTVHGAKGLESPIVFLPDTTPGTRQTKNETLVTADGMPIWPVSKAESPELVQQTKAVKSEAEKQERNRLLYVAMTRAESWLIVCGKAPGANAPKERKTWHELVSDGLERAGAKRVETDAGHVLRMAHGTWPEPIDARALETKGLPSQSEDPLLSLPIPASKLLAKRKSPSDLGGDKALGGNGLDEKAAKRRGTQIHLLLEHLPGCADPIKMAENLLIKGSEQADVSEIPAMLEEAQRNITAHPGLFSESALAEVDIAAMVPSLSSEIYGSIDRLIISPDHVLIVDFKTNAVVPKCAEDTPEGLLRQMGAYLEASEQIWTDRAIKVAILWTATAKLMVLPHGIVREALQRATTS
ncbi:MAG: double-strand break repair helicase AddA [Paracoccaceae bacterium]